MAVISPLQLILNHDRHLVCFSQYVYRERSNACLRFDQLQVQTLRFTKQIEIVRQPWREISRLVAPNRPQVNLFELTQFLSHHAPFPPGHTEFICVWLVLCAKRSSSHLSPFGVNRTCIESYAAHCDLRIGAIQGDDGRLLAPYVT